MTSCSSVIRPFSLFFSAFFSSTSSPPSSREFYILNNIRINPITSSLCNYLSNSEILRYYPPLSKDIANEGGGGRNMQISSSLIELLLFSSRSFRLRSSKVGSSTGVLSPRDDIHSLSHFIFASEARSFAISVQR